MVITYGQTIVTMTLALFPFADESLRDQVVMEMSVLFSGTKEKHTGLQACFLRPLFER